jgi:hypothetical protein
VKPVPRLYQRLADLLDTQHPQGECTSKATMIDQQPRVINEVEQLPSGTRSGKIISSHSIKTPPITLGAGQTVEFYVRNYSPLWATLGWSPSATGQIVGSDRSTSFGLIVSQLSAVGLIPFIKQPKPTAKPESAPSSSATPQAASTARRRSPLCLMQRSGAMRCFQ